MLNRLVTALDQVWATDITYIPLQKVAVAALTPVHAITVTSKLTAPTLQRGEPHTEQQGQFTGSRTIGQALVEDLQGLPVGIALSCTSKPASSIHGAGHEQSAVGVSQKCRLG
jgi:hypothetical protein